MTPEFALIFSQDTVRVQRRTADGWHELGQAGLEDEDLDEQLFDLRQSAAGDTSGTTPCGIVLPDSLIRFLNTPSDGRDTTALAVATLDGATPYPVDELVFDTAEENGTLHIAAVARETLDEAASFARAHLFDPVVFAGPDDGATFPRAPQFDVSVTDAVCPEANGPPAGAPAPEAVADEDIFDLVAEVQSEETINGFSQAPPAFRSASAPSGAPRAVLPHRAIAHAGQSSLNPDHSGLLKGFAVTVIALVFAGGALWASGLLGNGGILAWLDRPSQIPPDAQFASPPQPFAPEPGSTGTDVPDIAQTPFSPGVDAAIQEAMSVPLNPGPQPKAPDTPVNLRAEYAVTGIWPVAPEVPSPPALIDLEDMYVTSIDPVQASFDAVALPGTTETRADKIFLSPASPAAAGVRYALDARGMVIPTPGGALNPDGIRIFAGRPPARPPVNRPQVAEPGQDPVLRALLAGFRPPLRPTDLIENTERVAFSGLTRPELAQFRPRLRPASFQENAVASAASLVPRDSTNTSLLSDQTEPAEEVSENVIAVSLRPESRPSDFGLTVARAQQQPPAPQASVTTASVTPRKVAPGIPSSASATREATQKNAINLRRVNLIGVYGKPSDRRALIRLGNGRYQKVQVGDRMDGGKVSAIGDAELRYQKSGRNIILKMPRG